MSWPAGRTRVAVTLLPALALAALALGVALAWRAGAWPARSGGRPAALAHGAVVLLQGTPHYWVADEAGTLHWASDTRALVGRYVRWESLREVTPEALQALPRGAPWLAEPIAFVRAGERLYLVRWEAGLRWPTLLRVPSEASLALFGVTAEDVAARSTDAQTWERLVSLPLEASTAELTVPVAGGGGPPAPGDGAGWSVTWGGAWSGTGSQRYPATTYPVSVTLTRASLDPALGVVVGTVEYPSFPCAGRLGLIAAAGDELHLAERLGSGLERCTDGGRVTLARRTAQRLFYAWSLPDELLAVTGQLLREAAPPDAGTPTAAPARPGTPAPAPTVVRR